MAPAELYCTMVLFPEAPVESAPLPYSTQMEWSPLVIESGWVPPTATPVAKTPACADPPATRIDATINRLILPYSMRYFPMVRSEARQQGMLACVRDLPLTLG